MSLAPNANANANANVPELVADLKKIKPVKVKKEAKPIRIKKEKKIVIRPVKAKKDSKNSGTVDISECISNIHYRPGFDEDQIKEMEDKIESGYYEDSDRISIADLTREVERMRVLEAHITRLLAEMEQDRITNDGDDWDSIHEDLECKKYQLSVLLDDTIRPQCFLHGWYITIHNGDSDDEAPLYVLK